MFGGLKAGQLHQVAQSQVRLPITAMSVVTSAQALNTFSSCQATTGKGAAGITAGGGGPSCVALSLEEAGRLTGWM